MQAQEAIFPVTQEDRVFEYRHFFIFVADAHIGVRYFICRDGLLIRTGRARHDDEAYRKASHWCQVRYYSKPQ